MPRLDLVPIYMADRQMLLEKLRSDLQRILPFEIDLHRHSFDPEGTFDGSRGQYNSTKMLRLLLDDSSDLADYILGVASVDLFIPVLTFVYGEAQLDGKAAVVSIHRLQPEVYGLPADQTLLQERLLKEAVHELGHCFGLVHCPDNECVMHVSTYVEEVDLKTAGFCPSCAENIKNYLHAARPI